MAGCRTRFPASDLQLKHSGMHDCSITVVVCFVERIHLHCGGSHGEGSGIAVTLRAHFMAGKQHVAPAHLPPKGVWIPASYCRQSVVSLRGNSSRIFKGSNEGYIA